MNNLKEIINNCNSYKECMKYLGWNPNGTNYTKLKILIHEHGLTTEHFGQQSVETQGKNFKIDKIPMSEILIQNSAYTCRHRLKKRLVSEGLLNYKCFFCPNTGEWLGQTISLILDHINGVNNDNRLENLRFVCPNCNAALPTHCGKNKTNTANIKIPIKLSQEFFMKKNNHLRKVVRPPLAELKLDIEQLGYSGTGRKYGVSDTAIRKWFKIYTRE